MEAIADSICAGDLRGVFDGVGSIPRDSILDLFLDAGVDPKASESEFVVPNETVLPFLGNSECAMPFKCLANLGEVR